MNDAMKYIGVLTGIIMAVGASIYAALPFNYEHVKPVSETVSPDSILPICGLVVIAVAGYFWVKSDTAKRQQAPKGQSSSS
jgi:hypothetical protein